MRKVSVIGHFALGRDYLNGQTIKTKIVTGELARVFGTEQVAIVDTHGGWKNLLKAPVQVLDCLKNSEHVVILPAKNGLRVYGPLENRNWLAGKLKKFDGIYVETESMMTALAQMGFSNVYVMPNCKDLTILPESELVFAKDAPYKLCTFSRVMREKGIEEAVLAVQEVNRRLGRQVFTLDIYGQIDSNQTEWFAQLQETFSESVRYAGMVPFDQSVQVLKEYFALLFPTSYEGEGFAGTLIDAFSAGVPVVASDWKYNPEIVREQVGYVYPVGNQDAFTDILLRIAAEPEMILGKKLACLQEAQKYRIDQALRILVEKIEGE